jgi:hypothetical protein
LFFFFFAGMQVPAFLFLSPLAVELLLSIVQPIPQYCGIAHMYGNNSIERFIIG